MALARRLKRLEERAGLRGPCKACLGNGLPAVLALQSDKDEDGTRIGGCTECGAVTALKVVYLDWERV